MSELRHILVTGAAGFVGQHLVERLLREGLTVRAAVRSLRGAAHAAKDTCVVRDIGPGTQWSQALQGVDTVVHLAARVHVQHPTETDEAEFERVNVQGTQRLATQALDNGVRRFVFLSSVKVNGERTTYSPFRASDIPDPQDGYARSKLRAEHVLMTLARDRGLQHTVIRPPLVYGPGVGANFLRLVRLIERGLPLPLASVRNRRSLINVWNLCDVIVSALRAQVAVGRVLMASDDEDVSTPELLLRIGAAIGKPARLWACPPAMLRLAGIVMGRESEVQRLLSSLQVDISETRALLDWRPVMGLDDALRYTLRVLRAA